MNRNPAKTGIVLGFLEKPKRGPDGEKWHPLMSLVDHSQALKNFADIERLEKMVLFSQPHLPDENPADEFRREAQSRSPGLQIVTEKLEAEDFWDYKQVNAALLKFTAGFKFDPEAHHYFIYMSAGTHVAMICFYWFLENDLWPGDIVQTIYGAKGREAEFGNIRIIRAGELKNSLAQELKEQSEEIQRSLAEALHTDDPAFLALIKDIEASAIRSKGNVLLQGRTGTGKTILAKLIAQKRHEHKLLATSQFIAVNCSTLTGDLAYSTLFGHKKGAFTGAAGDHKGKLLEADEGLLFLDEIGDLGLREQAMLLKAIEEKKFTPLGGEEPKDYVSSDFQLICATNKDLFEEAARGRFRDDLLKRINVWNFKLPDFTERRGDLDKLLEAVLKERRTDKDGANLKGQPVFEAKARKKFLAFARSAEAKWTGNYRDLRAAVERMMTLAGSGEVTEAVVGKEINRLKNEWERGRSNDAVDELLGERGQTLGRLDRTVLACAIEVCRKHETQAQAAEELYGPRPPGDKSNLSSLLRGLLTKYDLSFKQIKD